MTQFEMITSTLLSGSGMCSISPFRNSTFVEPGLLLVLAREREHLVGHVETIGFARRPDAARRQQHVDAAARTEVEHRLPGAQFRQRCRVAAAERCGERFGRHFARLAADVVVRRDRIRSAARSR